MTRRELAGLVAVLPAAAARQQAPASNPSAQPAQAAPDELRKSIAAVRKLRVPADVEPAFSFRAR